LEKNALFRFVLKFFPLTRSRPVAALVLLPLFALLAACSSAQTDGPGKQLVMEDRFENGNRNIYALNERLDSAVLEPAAAAWRQTLPDAAQRAVSSHVSWTGLPATAMNSALQGKGENAGLALVHFAINGLTLGFVDLLEDEAERPQKEDFGQTMAAAGVPSGPYVMVPLLGGGTGRDMAGRVVTAFLDPLGSLTGVSASNQLVQANLPLSAISARADNFDLINQVKYESLDPYARLRSLYYQQREALLADRVTAANQSAVDDSLFDSFLNSEAETDQ
jgi:phospholipid-binding lipoprotein MlaA